METDALITMMSTACTDIATRFDSAVTTIGPIALGIFATFFVWKLALRFFKNSSSAAM